MTRFSRSGFAALLLAVAWVSAQSVAAESEGQPDLDKATQLKVNANTASDLGDVIDLCESALKKGLDPANVQFAKSLMASSLVQRATIRARAERLDAALEDLNKAVEADPQNPSGYELQGLILAKQKKFDEALAILEKGRKVAPEAISFHVQKAGIYVMQDNRKAALDELNKAAALEPENANVLMLRAGIYQEMGEKQKALDDVDRVRKLNPDFKTATRTRAMLLADMGKYDEALAELESLRKDEPKDPLTLLQLGMLYHYQKKHEKAIEILTSLLADYPGEWVAYRSRADAELAVGRRGDAIADYDKASQLQPKDSGVLNNLAWVLATAPEDKLRDGKRAITLATEACKLTNYKQAHILSTLAAAYAETGDFKEAVKWSTKAVEIGSEEHGDQLKQELESYKTGKPWREELPAPGDKTEKKTGEKKREKEK